MIIATKYNDHLAAELALGRGANADYVLMLVASTEIAEQKEWVEFLHQRGASLAGALLLAVSNNEYREAAKPLVNLFGADPTVALAKATLNNHSMEVRQALLELGANAEYAKTLTAPDTNAMALLLAAAEAGKEDEANFLIAHRGISPTSALAHAAQTGDFYTYDVRKMLISLGANEEIALVELINEYPLGFEDDILINKHDYSLNLALATALRKGYGAKVALPLLKLGAKLEDIFGETNTLGDKIRRSIRSSYFGDAAAARSDASLPYISDSERGVDKIDMRYAREYYQDTIKDISTALRLYETVGIRTQTVLSPLSAEEVSPAIASLGDFYKGDMVKFFEDHPVAGFSIAARFAIAFEPYSLFDAQDKHPYVVITKTPNPFEFESHTSVVSMN